ncbi:glycosyltransferase family 2 protein [Tellurirhabdus bombi]|uniref:glycosyltransferase family 2 protein n=1 Tax=Tellurirhabdus bombi TaxID=2907205 RepID=UPI001F2434A5|nr:glycosyltransferase [Tellurirhabdus bombi]
MNASSAKKTAAEPLVSVIMPVYNAERYVRQAVESILQQTYTNLELLILNNGSTDATPRIIASLGAQDARIRIITHDKPLGFGGEKASNLAENRAKGNYIAKLDADDIAHPDRLAKQVAFLEANPDVFLVGSWLSIIDSEGKVVGKREYPLTHEAIYQGFYFRCCVGNPAVMYRSHVVRGEFYQLRFPHFNDYYSLFLHMRAGLRFANLPEPLTRYRVHTTNTVFTDIREKWNTNMAIKRTFVEEFGYRPVRKDVLLLNTITWLLNNLPSATFAFILRLRAKLSV